MVNFAELKAKAEKVKDAGVSRVTNTRDRLSSVPTSKANWDPNWKRGVPPPPPASARVSSSARPGPPSVPSRSRIDDNVGPGSGIAPPSIPLTSRPAGDAGPPPYAPRPPPTRAPSGYPTRRETPDSDVINKIDWTNLSAEDKEALFDWLDEFFARYLQVELGPRERRVGPPVSSSGSRAVLPVLKGPPPMINTLTRPQV